MWLQAVAKILHQKILLLLILIILMIIIKQEKLKKNIVGERENH